MDDRSTNSNTKIAVLKIKRTFLKTVTFIKCTQPCINQSNGAHAPSDGLFGCLETMKSGVMNENVSLSDKEYYVCFFYL